MPGTSLKRNIRNQDTSIRSILNFRGRRRRRTTFSRNNSSFLDSHLNLEEKGNTWRLCSRKVVSLIRFKKDPLLPFLLQFQPDAPPLFQYREERKGFSLSLSLVERDDNCVNSIQKKKEKRKGKKEGRRPSRFHEWNRPKFTRVKNIFRVIARDCFRRNFTLVKRYFRIESKLRNKYRETSWLETLSTTSWNWSRDSFCLRMQNLSERRVHD